MQEDRIGWNDATAIGNEWPPFAVPPHHMRMVQPPAIDADLFANGDALTGERDNGLDQRRHATDAEAEAQISTRTGHSDCVGVRWANEDEIADQDRAVGFDYPPQP